jgi:uncharacterized oxidoreductase
MKLSNNTILITGGSSGLGLEMSRRFLERSNKVIICGRSEEKLKEAHRQYPNLIPIQCDLSDEKQCIDLAEKLKKEHPDLNVLVNNAAIVHKTKFTENETILEAMEAEFQTNFMAPVRLIKYLYPILLTNSRPHIINITTGLIYTPRANYPFYNATKAALHSFTQVLRIQQEEDPVGITEVMFPAVDTPWHNGKPPKIAISAEKAVDEMLNGLKQNKEEIRVAAANLIYRVSRIAPGFALKKVNSLQEA